MIGTFTLVAPKITPPLDAGFLPAALANRHFAQETASDGQPLVIGLEREAGKISRYETCIFPDGHPRAEANRIYAERLVKFLLWQRGGYKIYVGGSPAVAGYLRSLYRTGGRREFDSRFMSQQVYERPFEVLSCLAEEVPSTVEEGELLGRHLDGCRIGFDLGASDRKASALVDGKVIYSEEVIWEPRKQTDPAYHYNEIMAALKAAAAKMERLDAIGGSSAGIYIQNRPMVASLFRGIPAERFSEIQDLFLRIRKELNVPLVVINDGDVAALAGSMSLEDNGVLGLAMGSSEAAGYIAMNGRILGWLNELAFAPVDYSSEAPVDEWSGDAGCGSQYYSQQCVFRLAPKAGIHIPAGLTDAERLAFVQEKLEAGHEGAEQIWRSMGIYLGYGLAHYADFYDIRHVLLLGRCTSGKGGSLILEEARNVLEIEFPELAGRLNVRLPDEKSRRVGQAVAAASLPARD
ncbi:MAG: ROK family protein [Chloroflexi bacterium]|nr:ROK family protein [Chloroflexota bacterium]